MTRLGAVPMTAAEWRQGLADLSRQAAVTDAEDQADILRVARTLMAVAPESEAHRFGDLPSRASFEALLAVEAWESAALALLPEAAGYLFSKSGDGIAIASLVLPDCTEDVSAEADSPALAVVSALAAALMAVMVTAPNAAAGSFFDKAAMRQIGGSDGFEIEQPWELRPALLH